MTPSKMLKFKRRVWAGEVRGWRPRIRSARHPLHATFRAMWVIHHWVKQDVHQRTVTLYGWRLRAVDTEA